MQRDEDGDREARPKKRPARRARGRLDPRRLHVHFGRAAVFAHREAAGLPYAVCSCPGPEADGGCMLTNWHYAGGDDEILLPNESLGFGRRCDPGGRVLPCREHPERSGRPCLGCGCDHAQRERASRGGERDDAGP